MLLLFQQRLKLSNATHWKNPLIPSAGVSHGAWNFISVWEFAWWKQMMNGHGTEMFGTGACDSSFEALRVYNVNKYLGDY